MLGLAKVERGMGSGRAFGKRGKGGGDWAGEGQTGRGGEEGLGSRRPILMKKRKLKQKTFKF